MAITIKSDREIALMRHAGHVLSQVHNELAKEIHEGMTTKEVGDLCEEIILSYEDCRPNFKGYDGFPASACVSLNEEIVHGIPDPERVIQDGDIVSIDTGVDYMGYQSDAARTIAIGNVSSEARHLIEVTRQCFFEGVRMVKPGVRTSEISKRIGEYAASQGFTTARDLTGHGIGTDMHEEPMIPNKKMKMRGIVLEKGMAIAIEPMLCAGTDNIWWMDNDWTIVTADGRLSAHYENSVAVTDYGYEILTLV
ncbi:MAG: type I methionyl aminopeptidase [Lachnospiraceae bacterium]|nr:type I methionyl aminopeptidase [Lachnospiraceae bacterium]